MDHRVSGLLRELQDGVRNYLDSDTFTEWLTAVSRFHRYSINNIFLILMQYPGATQVASFRTWKQLGCRVRKGEKGIRILVPVRVRINEKDGAEEEDYEEEHMLRFKVGHVFDISQVEGTLPEPGIRELTESVDGFDRFLMAAERIAPVPIRFATDLQGDVKGYFSPSEKEIVIRAGMPQAQTAKTVLHELAHAVMHAGPESRKIDRATKEVQAESVAYICSRALLGMESVGEYSFGYIGTWSSSLEVKELMASLKEIRDTASELLDQFREYLDGEESALCG